MRSHPSSFPARPLLRLTLFGGFRASWWDGRPLSFSTRKIQALAAYLGLQAPHDCTRDHLATLFWGESSQERARNSVRQALFGLRQALGDEADACLAVEEDRIGFRAGALISDVGTFQALVESESPAVLQQAARLYAGELLEGAAASAAFEEWLVVRRERLRELAVDALRRLLAHQQAHEPDAAIGTALTLLGLDPLQESVHRTLMRLYVQAGRRGSALRQFTACADRLRHELDADVEPETRRLHEDILASAAVRAGTDDPPRGRILLVEDDPATSVLVERYLRMAGYRVAIARDGLEAVERLHHDGFDLIVSDIAMPGLDGLALLEKLAAAEAATPVILITAAEGSDAEVRGLSLGAADYIRKPVRKDVLLLRVGKALGLRPAVPPSEQGGDDERDDAHQLDQDVQ